MFNAVAMIGYEPLIIVALVVLLLFGPKKIPELMRGVGQGVGELKKGLEEGKQHFTAAVHEEPKTPTATTETTPATTSGTPSAPAN